MRRPRRRRNAPYGSTSAEVRQAGNPRRGAKQSGIVLGKLNELVIETKTGVKKFGRGALSSRAYLAWLPAAKTLAVVYKKPGKQNPRTLSSAVRKLHLRFHEAAPKEAGTFDWPDKKGPLRLFGLIRSLTYSIPPHMRSPGKQGCYWVHAFGDHGESGHGPLRGEKKYPDRYKPGAMLDNDGNLFIVRRPGNRYDVTEWIYW